MSEFGIAYMVEFHMEFRIENATAQRISAKRIIVHGGILYGISYRE